jgi:hypothetical protein
MATMLNDRDSTDRHLDLTRRHIRLCKQVKGASSLATAIEPALQALLQKQAATKTKLDARQDALDDFILRDLELDDGVRTAFEKCKQFAQANLRQQYEINYLEARKTLGRSGAERLFPRPSAGTNRDEAEPPAVNSHRK